MAIHNTTGSWGETQATTFLEGKGYEIIEKNYRHKHAEIDLIVKKNKTLIFVEVKTRSGTGFGMPEEFVNYTKAKLIMKAAENYIYTKDWHFDIRFDIISILILSSGGINIKHIEDAFSWDFMSWKLGYGWVVGARRLRWSRKDQFQHINYKQEAPNGAG